VLAGDALEVHVDREKAALEGIAPDTVTVKLKVFLSGTVTTQVQQGPKMVEVRVWTPEHNRATARHLTDLRLRAPDGHLFRYWQRNSLLADWRDENSNTQLPASSLSF